MYTLDQLEQMANNCKRCPLSRDRKKVVFGQGNPDAKIMLVGEGPGYYEDKLGQPFVGKAGQLLDKMLDAIEIKRQEIYISNVVKCRPPGNRNPKEEEINQCIEFLRWQVKLIGPKIIVCLGAVAAKAIIRKDFKITRERGIWFEKGPYSIIATYHPAALLRDKEKKEESWEDLKKIREKYNEIKN